MTFKREKNVYCQLSAIASKEISRKKFNVGWDWNHLRVVAVGAIETTLEELLGQLSDYAAKPWSFFERRSNPGLQVDGIASDALAFFAGTAFVDEDVILVPT